MEPSRPGKLSNLLIMQFRMRWVTPSKPRQLQCKDTLEETGLYIVHTPEWCGNRRTNRGNATQGRVANCTDVPQRRMGQPLFIAVVITAGVIRLANIPAVPSRQVDKEHGNISNVTQRP